MSECCMCYTSTATEGGGLCWACYHDLQLAGETDPVNKPAHSEVDRPKHYIFGPYELRAVLDEWVDTMDIPKSEACDWFSMMQYLFRYPRKGKPARDLDKAIRYLKWIRERYD